MNARELVAFLCEDLAHDAARMVAAWVVQSRHFHAFATDNRAKIRKKLRTATSPESQQSVLLELEVARHLLADRRCRVDYERYGQGQMRSPDLTVVFRDRHAVNVEVTQMLGHASDPLERQQKLIALVCGKLGQMVPDAHNVLVVAPVDPTLSSADVGTAMKQLKGRVEQRDPGYLERFGFADPSAFFRQFQWLSAVVVWPGPGNQPAGASGLWTNPQARRALPTGVAAVLLRRPREPEHPV